jgi:hypothetical protein
MMMMMMMVIMIIIIRRRNVDTRRSQDTLFAPSLCSLVATEQETPKGSEHLRD